jgi:hypothetical protein
MILLYLEELKEVFLFKENKPFDIFIFEKPNVNRLEDGSLTKDGIHMIIGCKVEHGLQLIIRERILKKLEEEWSDLPLINSWDSVLDEGISKGTTNWQLFGSRKPANEAYELTRHFEISYDGSDREFMMFEKKTEDFDLKNNFIKLSVQCDTNPKFEINPKYNEYNKKITRDKKVTIKTKKVSEDTDSETDSDTGGELIVEDVYYKYLNCIGSKMCGRGQHLETIKVLQALKNEECDKKYVEYWIKTFCSPEFKKYSYALNHYNSHIKYTSLSTERRLSIKSLKNWAKFHNPKLYATYFKDDFEFQIKSKYNIDNLIQTHGDEGDIMELIYSLIKDYVILDNEFIYLYYNDEWNKMKEKDCKMLKHFILEIFIIYGKVALDIINTELKNNLNDEEQIEKCKKLHKITCFLIITIKQTSYINSICTMLKNKLATKKNEIVFDLGEENFYKIHFRNGVYDTKEKKFSSRTETDYITQYLPYDYKKETEIDDNIKKEVLGFFQKIQPDEEQQKFTLSYLAYCLTGNTTKQVFKMNIGHTASNGKSTEMSIHEKCFELYSMKADSRVLQLNFEKRHKFLNDLVYKPIRFLYFEELPKGKKLDVEFIKDFVDGKKLTLEKMFGTTDKFKIQAKLMSASNHDFEVDTDEGILRRGRVQFYESKFTDDLDCIDETNHIYKKEEGFENKFNDDNYKNAYFHLLLKYVDNLYVPNKNKEDFKQKAEEGDNILNHILEYFEITNNVNDTVGKSEIENILGKDNFKPMKDKLQSKGCKYDSQKRYWCEDEKKQKKGVFTNIKPLA